MSKFTKIPSEINEFFKEKRRDAAIFAFTRLLDDLRLDNKMLGGVKRDNCQFTNLQIFQLLIPMPIFAVLGLSHYASSGFGL